MAKRLQLNFNRPQPGRISEDGQTLPCVVGRKGVNLDTKATLASKAPPRSDPWGRPIESPGPDDGAGNEGQS
jgi:hypothetical protein